MTTDEAPTSEAAVDLRPTTEITSAAADALRRISVTIEDQPPPVPSDRPAVWGLVIADMGERDQVGRQRYGTPLQPHNGRDALVDAYQESLDQVVYLRQEIEERRDLRGELAEVRGVLERLRRALLTPAEVEVLRDALSVAVNEGTIGDVAWQEIHAALDRATRTQLSLNVDVTDITALEYAIEAVRARASSDKSQAAHLPAAADKDVRAAYDMAASHGAAALALLRRMRR